MSSDFRPVREEWGPHSSGFVDAETLVSILEAIADHTIENGFDGNYLERSRYGEYQVLWVSRGTSFLDFIESGSFTADWVLNALEDQSPESEDVRSLTSNMQNLAASWRKLLDSDGSLRFYIG